MKASSNIYFLFIAGFIVEVTYEIPRKAGLIFNIILNQG